MTKPLTLREWLSRQSMPPEIQTKLTELFHLSEQWRVSRSTTWSKGYANELDEILDTIPEKTT